MSQYFFWIALFSIITLMLSSIATFFDKYKKIAHALMLIYSIIWTFGIIFLWLYLERAPFKTLGETRLWYAYLVPVIGWILFIRHRWKWIMSYASMLAIVFILTNLLKPENFSKELMPALQSIWFAPHVMVYMFAYALFGIVSMISAHYLFFKKNKDWNVFIQISMELVYTGFAFLTLGLLFGAFWAKQAWGHYWTWDPKEVWALATWLVYLLHIHVTIAIKNRGNIAAYFLLISFAVLLLCWFGVNYLPIAQYSVHTY